MKKIGIVFAMNEELEALKQLLEIEKEYNIFELMVYEGKINNVEFVLIESGVGKVNAARSTQILIDNFTDIFDVKFTAKIEEQFDEIAEGNEEWKKLVREFYNPFSVELARVEKELEHVVIEDEVSDVPCDKCGRLMVYKYGKFGKFLACPGYPECKNAKPIVETVDVPCPVCGPPIGISVRWAMLVASRIPQP